MSKEIYISSTPHETRLAIVENDDLSEIYYERENEYTLAGSIYNGKVTRVLPGMQSSFVDIGLERDAFLYITDFMEEAGDSAEFDSAEGGGTERRGRGDRNGRPRRESSPEGESSANGDNSQSRNGHAESRRPSSSSPGVTEQPSQDLTAEPQATPAGESSTEGEAAPEGSRRWRGRRGRRRGRNGSEREPRPETTGVTTAGETRDLLPAEDVPAPDEEGLELGAAAEDRAAEEAYTSDAYSPEPIADESFAPRENVSGTRDGGSRRDRDRRPPRAPRGFTPSRALYGLDENRESTDAPSGEPIVLPGESLAKYRPETEASRTAITAAAPASAPAAAAAFVLPGAWSGGDVMPGETIRPRGNTPGRSERENPSRSGRDDRRDGGSRSDRREAGPRSDRQDRTSDRHAEQRRDRRGDQRLPSASPANQSAASAESTSAEARTSLDEPAGILAAAPSAAADAPAFSTAEAPPATHSAVSTGAATEAQPSSPDDAVTGPERLEPVADYDPAEASASHRFDPVPPREYRQSAPVLEAEPPAPTALTTTEQTTTAATTHTITPPAGVPLAPLVSGEAAPGHTATADHAFTSINPDGEMLSEAALPQPQEVAEPTAPIRHETAVVEETFAAAENVASSYNAPPDLSSGQSQHATEDLLDADLAEDENAAPTVLHASAIEEMDYDEEETLEGAADLGSMIREMSIDEITAPDDALHEQSLLGEEEVDFEEEDATEISEHYSAFDDEASDSREAAPDEDAGDEHDTESTRESAEFPTDQPSALTEAPAPRSGERHNREGSSDGRRHGRRDNRRGGGREDRARSTGGSDDRSARSTGMRHGGRRDRHSAQTTNLPAISDLLKPGQELLVQIAKEPIAKKGARITSHIALPGRFLVFMPTVNHMGVSRKIESDGERRRLKEILLSEKGDATGGFIVRTAAANASEEELRSDLRFLLNLWADIKQRSESSKSPALIYHDLNLVERILRDQVTDNFSAIWVDSEGEYERVLRFLQRFQPSLIRRVKLYSKETPLFEQFGLQEEINKALRSKVWLKSGGSIVINQTEALVAIDINTGKYVGKTARLEDTIVKTNLDAIPEIVRQIRLRDLGGIIIIDFIDMDERKNRHRVMAALEDELKKDRAPSKVLQFNDFGLVAITRKRVKQSLERTLSTTCTICTGTGMTKSPVTVCNEIFVEMRKMQKHLDRGDVMLRVNPEVVKQLKSPTARWLQEMEDMVGKTILVKSDPTLHPEQFDIH